jgi:hypothetical protein
MPSLVGCISCKKRHVKCDERKPGCLRCENMGRECEGYALPKAAKTISRAERTLLPRPQPASLAPQPVGPALQSPSSQPPLLISPGLGFDLIDDDSWYYSIFREQVAYDLSPCHGTNFWITSSLRDSMTLECIRHSILSIGAYARALDDLRNEYPLLTVADRPWWPATIFNRHRQAAFGHHAQALSSLRREMATNGVDGRTTMAATLLFIVFENMTGNYHASGTFIRSGIKMLNNTGRTRSRGFLCQDVHDAFDAPDEMDQMAHMFSQHSISSVLMPFPHGKSAYHMLLEDDDDYDSPSDDDSHHDQNNSNALSAEYKRPRATVPRTLRDAHAIWERTLPELGQFYAKALWRNLNPNYVVDDNAMADQTWFLARLQDFGTGICALTGAAAERQQQRGDAESGEQLRRLKFLAIHLLVATILLSCCLDRTEATYDDFTLQFEDVVRRVREYADLYSAPIKSGFSNDVGLLPVITFVASKCRVHRVRLDAMQLLRTAGWREGPWDGISLWMAMTNLMQLEGQQEVPMDEEMVFPPLPEARYAWTNMFWDFENRRMTMEYTKLWPNELGELKKVVRTVLG